VIGADHFVDVNDMVVNSLPEKIRTKVDRWLKKTIGKVEQNID
jgi:hypothetical protein